MEAREFCCHKSAFEAVRNTNTIKQRTAPLGSENLHFLRHDSDICAVECGGTKASFLAVACYVDSLHNGQGTYGPHITFSLL